MHSSYNLPSGSVIGSMYKINFVSKLSPIIGTTSIKRKQIMRVIVYSSMIMYIFTIKCNRL